MTLIEACFDVATTLTEIALREGRMPHIASSVVDDDAVKLIRDWIKQLPR